jgi:glycosyltransferase involved in cell wall biosynthesis
MPSVSVVVPCYNQGVYLEEALQSIYNQTFHDYEIIVVDDGSTDSITPEIIARIRDSRTTTFRINNCGLASARNFGISKASGKYILPLDSDDKIGAEYIEKAVSIIESNDSIGIVYCKANFFGDETGEWLLPEFDSNVIKLYNLIFCSALFRREDWEFVGGYKRNMVFGWEDWDFWLSILQKTPHVYKIPEILFFYRKKQSSMITGLLSDPLKELIMKLQIVFNHPDIYSVNPSVFSRMGNEVTDMMDASSSDNSEWIYIGGKRIKKPLGYKIVDKIYRIYNKIRRAFRLIKFWTN